ncbi:dimethylarginine dimethylaminohydrolase family protein [Phenylobacterium aquaticum]|uniref:dimethylarginine dimethylaminohydrolase family protein n=1 Tax=Phenylobacterium aquaticum TaxID=1763816 RepID=UPI0026F2C743|nr:arginine deiminase family protein [Phenylobacterium aquaticum]
MIPVIVRALSPRMADGERTHLGRAPIDMALALVQHEAYAAALTAAGGQVTVLAADDLLADCAFVEDVAVVLPELSLVCRPGAASRRPEAAQVAPFLPADRPRVDLAAGTLDGGDVLVVGRRIFVGLSTRTSPEGLAAFEAAVAPHGYAVIGVPVPGALHLKTAATALGPDRLLVNPAWVEPAAFEGFAILEVAEDEPFAANTLSLAGTLFTQAGAPGTFERLTRAGYAPVALEISEFAKAEAGLTCLSLIVPALG